MTVIIVSTEKNSSSFDLGQEASKVCSHAREHFLFLSVVISLLFGFLFLFPVTLLLMDEEGWRDEAARKPHLHVELSPRRGDFVLY